MVDCSVKYHIGILEDILVRICQLYIPTDFVMMDVKEDSNILILLRRPFLDTIGAIIDVKWGKLNFEVGEEKIEFILYQVLKAPIIDDSCCFIDIIDECLKELLLEVPLAKKPVVPTASDMEEAEAEVLLDEGLDQCLTLTPNPMRDIKKSRA